MKAYPRDDGQDHLNRQVAAVIEYCRGDRGLDVGCGFYKVHPGAIGLDRNPCTGADIIADGRRLPFPDETFDYVASVHSFLEMWDPEATIREWARVIKPGGHLILLVEDKRYLPPLGHPDSNPRYHYLFTPEELCRLVGRFPLLEPVKADSPGDGILSVVCRRKPRRSYRILFCCDLLRVSTGDYFIKALEELGHQVVTAGQGRDIPRAGEVALVDLLRETEEVGFVPDLVIEHESGTVLSTEGRPSGLLAAWIEVDATTHHAGHAIRARDFDFVFTMQPAFVDYFRRHGNPHTYPLPAACDPQIHRPVPAAEVYDLGFVGSTFLPYYEERVRYLERLRSRFSVAFTSALYDDMNLVYCQSRMVFNKTVAGNLNARVFEGMACGRLVLTDEVPGLRELFTDGVHLAFYRPGNLEEVVAYYLAHPEERGRIAARGREEVLARHTYRHRAEALLETLFGA